MARTRHAVALAWTLALLCAPGAQAVVFTDPVDPGADPLAGAVAPCAPTGLETVATDDTNYPNFGTVQVTGAGYSPACEVVIRITRPDGSVVRGDATETPGSDTVGTSTDGSLAYTYLLTDVSGSYLVEVLGEGDAVLAQTSFFDAASITELRRAGLESYLFTAGESVEAVGTVAETNGSQNRWYRWFVLNPSGTTVQNTACAAAGTNPSGATFAVTNTYVVQPGDQLSTSANWTYRLVEYQNNTCTLNPSTDNQAFQVAASSTFSNAAGTTPKSVFGAGGTAYLRVSGIADNSDWDVTWVLPSGVDACTNTAGGDRPNSDNGVLPDTGDALRYLPGANTEPSQWNRLANYNAATCPAMAAANEGLWKLRVRDDDQRQVLLPAFTVDATAPNTTIDDQPGNPSNDSTPSFEFSGTDNIAAPAALTFECSLDGAAFAACTSPKEYGTTADGEHTFQVRAVDRAGNVDASPASYTWTIDTAAPAAPNITVFPDDPTNETTADFEWTGAETGGSFECKLDDGAFALCTSPQSYTGLEEGDHDFSVRQLDAAGNVGTAADYSWFVDLTAPETTLDVHTPNPSNDPSPEFTFAGTDNHSDAEDLTFECKLDDGDWEACTSPESVGPLDEGEHTFAVRAIDEAGNTDASPPDYTWFVDLTAPETTIDAAPSDPSKNASPSFEFSATDNHSAAEDLTFECKLDDGAWDPCTSPESVGPLEEGEHTFRVRATDEAGNVGAADEHTWFVDLSAPVTTIDAAPSDPSKNASPSFEFSATDNHSDAEDLTFECKLDDGDWDPCTSPESVGPLEQGEHTFAVRATDEAGNLGAADAHTWFVDLTEPETQLDDTPADPSNDASPSFEFSGTDNHTAAGDLDFECKLDDGDWGSCDSPHDYTDLADGSHTFRVRAVDAAGNADSTPEEFDWVIDTVEPDSEASSPATTNDTADTFDVTYEASDDRSGLASVKLYASKDGGPYELANTDPSPGATGTFAFEHDGDGTYRFYTIATDLAGNVEAIPVATDDVTVVEEDAKTLRDTVAPTVTLDTPPPATNDSTPTISGTAGNQDAATNAAADDDHVTVTVEDELGTVIQTHANVTIQSDDTFSVDAGALADGNYTARAEQLDGAGNLGSAERDFEVDTDSPDAPTITESPELLTSSDEADFEWTGAEPGGSFECKLDGGTFEACTSPKSYADLLEDHHTFSVRQVDAAGNEGDAASFEWDTDYTMPETTIDSEPDDPSNDSTPTFEFSGTDNHSAAGDLTFECNVDGGGWNPCSSPETLAALDDDSHTFEVRATDEAGNTDSAPASYTWTVDADGPDAPSITVFPEDPTKDTAASFEWTGAEPGGSFECKLDSGTYEACTSPQGYTALSEDHHTFSVRQIDAAGNEGDAASHEWDTDYTEPDTTIDDQPDDPSNDATPAFAFSGADAHSAAGDLTFECNVDGGGWNPCSSPETLAALDDDSHTFEVRATDEAGNTDTSPASYTWTVDTAAPAAPAISTPAEGSFHGTTSITVTGTADPDTTVELFDGASSLGTTPVDGSGDWSKAVTLGGGGSRSLTATATDAATNTSDASAVRTVNVDLTAPESQASGPATSSSTTINLTYTASDNAGGSGLNRVELWVKPPSAAAYSLAATDTTPTATQSFAYTAAGNGTYSFYTVAVDQVGHTEGAPASPDVATVVNTAPAFAFSGFRSPVDNLPTVNSAKAGSTIPVKFSLGGNHGLNIFEPGYPKSQEVLCYSGATVDGIEETAAPGASELRYDAATSTYHYNWKTDRSWAGCRQLVLKFVDGQYARANFKFK